MSIIKAILSVEYYRTMETTGDTDDYMVDAVKIFDVELPGDCLDTDKQEQTREGLSALAKKVLSEFNESTDLQALRPLAWKHISGGMFWFHVIAKDALAAIPKDFHTGGFSEAELLGVEAAPQLDMLFNSTGEPIPGHPDKFMLGMGAV